MTIEKELKSRIPIKIWTDDIDYKSIDQLKDTAQVPFIGPHISVMPDVHWGLGATIGSVIPTTKAIIPAAVGVDIGCGMVAVQTSLTTKSLPDSLKRTRSEIEAHVPVGFNFHKEDDNERDKVARTLSNGYERILEDVKKLDPSVIKRTKVFNNKWTFQLGTLGGGNHFIELCKDENEDVWIMLHSGSRGIGNQIAQIYIKQAKRQMDIRQDRAPNKDLSWLVEEDEGFDEYIHGVNWCQEYAYKNRQEILRLTIEALRKVLPPFYLKKKAINCHHNYVTKEFHYRQYLYLTRKGAISAQEDELGIIPGSMGAKSFIVKGKGNKESFHSASHGAGRVMSRTQAKEKFNTNNLRVQTKGIECRKDKGVIDEIPAAYKDIDKVIEHQSDLIKVVHTLNQLVCVKG